jgi:hypothetical protein
VFGYQKKRNICIKIPALVISDLISKPFSEISKIIKTSKSFPNFTSIYKDKKVEYIRYFIISWYDDTIWLMGSCEKKLYCWSCLLFYTENCSLKLVSIV